MIAAAPYVTVPPVGSVLAAGGAAMDGIFHVMRMAATAIADMRNGETAAGIFNGFRVVISKAQACADIGVEVAALLGE
ncbi:hypothetical protein GCM10011400_33080 [Paraburkholderia caffeinilytica]|uniref:Uncharacterized protein n=1 Tax=Paraburkholderia caffeinilytica TaxID=1761016 RepID=A0ABQ1MNI0_9BURK|nr:hypothetical protein GCM10011400_33080 [Paraburkholderia caffeinilytica]